MRETALTVRPRASSKGAWPAVAQCQSSPDGTLRNALEGDGLRNLEKKARHRGGGGGPCAAYGTVRGDY